MDTGIFINMKKVFKFKSKVWLYPGMSGWHFVGVPKIESDVIKKGFVKKAGFGSVPVIVTVGKTIWETSIFPDKRTGTYLLPLKLAVRKREAIVVGEEVSLSIEIV